MHALTTEDKPVWVEVKTALPESFVSVLGYVIEFNEPNVDIVCYNPDTKKWYCSIYTMNGEETFIDDYEIEVTYWMRLPEPPIVS